MRSLEELRAVIESRPDDFNALYEMTMAYRQEHNYAACFAMSERLIASYDKRPIANEQNRYFEIKRLHSQMMREHLADILGPSSGLLDTRWMPVFRLGRPREMAWKITPSNARRIRAALEAPQLKKLRFLSITFEDSPNEALKVLREVYLGGLKVLNLIFMNAPDESIFHSLWANAGDQFKNICSFSLRMPFINTSMAISVRNAFGPLESLSMTSLDRRGIDQDFAEYLADDLQSQALTRLALVGTSIGDEGLFALFSSENFNNLQALDLHDGILTNNAGRVFQAAHNLPKLRHVDVRYNNIDPAGINMIQHACINCVVEGQHTRPVGRI